MQTSLPIENEKLDYYRQYMQDSTRQINEFELSVGYLRYLQGVCLNRFMESANCNKGDYQVLLDSVGMKKQTAWNCRQIAKRFTAEQAKEKTYTGMVEESKKPAKANKPQRQPTPVSTVTIAKRLEEATTNVTKALSIVPDHTNVVKALEQLETIRDRATSLAQSCETLIRKMDGLIESAKQVQKAA